MDEEMIQTIRNQHLESYRKAILEIISNNTSVLMNDISSLFDKPPLDSMDSIRNKLLSGAKKYQIILNTDGLIQLLDAYREEVKKCIPKIETLRIHTLSSKLKHFSFIDDNSIFVLYKKDFSKLNRDIKKILKDQMNSSFEKEFLKKVSMMFQESIEENIQNSMIEDFSKFMKSNFQKQIIESFEIKVLVKDTTLMNSIKEQSDRYLFTINNSRLLNPLE